MNYSKKPEQSNFIEKLIPKYYNRDVFFKYQNGEGLLKIDYILKFFDKYGRNFTPFKIKLAPKTMQNVAKNTGAFALFVMDGINQLMKSKPGTLPTFKFNLDKLYEEIQTWHGPIFTASNYIDMKLEGRRRLLSDPDQEGQLMSDLDWQDVLITPKELMRYRTYLNSLKGFFKTIRFPNNLNSTFLDNYFDKLETELQTSTADIDSKRYEIKVKKDLFKFFIMCIIYAFGTIDHYYLRGMVEICKKIREQNPNIMLPEKALSIINMKLGKVQNKDFYPVLESMEDAFKEESRVKRNPDPQYWQVCYTWSKRLKNAEFGEEKTELKDVYVDTLNDTLANSKFNQFFSKHIFNILKEITFQLKDKEKFIESNTEPFKVLYPSNEIKALKDNYEKFAKDIEDDIKKFIKEKPEEFSDEEKYILNLFKNADIEKDFFKIVNKKVIKKNLFNDESGDLFLSRTDLNEMNLNGPSLMTIVIQDLAVLAKFFDRFKISDSFIYNIFGNYLGKTELQLRKKTEIPENENIAEDNKEEKEEVNVEEILENKFNLSKVYLNYITTTLFMGFEVLKEIIGILSVKNYISIDSKKLDYETLTLQDMYSSESASNLFENVIYTQIINEATETNSLNSFLQKTFDKVKTFYKDKLGVDLSYMKLELTDKVYSENGSENTESPRRPNKGEGDWTEKGIVYFRDGQFRIRTQHMDDTNKEKYAAQVMAHELAHECYHKDLLSLKDKNIPIVETEYVKSFEKGSEHYKEEQYADSLGNYVSQNLNNNEKDEIISESVELKNLEKKTTLKENYFV